MSLKHGKYKIDYVLELKKYKMKIYTKLKKILLRQIWCRFKKMFSLHQKQPPSELVYLKTLTHRQVHTLIFPNSSTFFQISKHCAICWYDTVYVWKISFVEAIFFHSRLSSEYIYEGIRFDLEPICAPYRLDPVVDFSPEIIGNDVWSSISFLCVTITAGLLLVTVTHEHQFLVRYYWYYYYFVYWLLKNKDVNS